MITRFLFIFDLPRNYAFDVQKKISNNSDGATCENRDIINILQYNNERKYAILIHYCTLAHSSTIADNLYNYTCKIRM